MKSQAEIDQINKAFFDRVDKCIERAAKIRVDRMDYNTRTPVEGYLLHGPEDFVYEIYKKAKRADDLLAANAPREKVDDCMLDIINYAAYVMTILYQSTEPINKA